MKTEKGLYVFIGENGSLGYLTGVVYFLEVEFDPTAHPTIKFPKLCPYSSYATFKQNWQELPDGK